MQQRPSGLWIAVAYFAFIGVEVVLGGMLSSILGGFVSRHLAMRIEVLLVLGSYGIGGFMVGLFSPDERVLEPAVAAGLAVLTSFLYALFMPVSFFRFSAERLGMAAVVAFGCALGGAHLGETTAARITKREG